MRNSKTVESKKMNNSGKVNTGKVKKSRTGFTLVELLVVIAIIGILASMLMPAINSARESARGAQCGSNARNLGIAAQSYSGQNREKIPAISGNQGGSGLVELMPYLELSNAYDAISNGTALTKKVPIFMCPSGVNQDGMTDDGTGNDTNAAMTNYVQCIGTSYNYCQSDPTNDNGDPWEGDSGDAGDGDDPSGYGADGPGAFRSTRTSRASMARDGESNTLFYSEKSDTGQLNGTLGTVIFHTSAKPNNATDGSINPSDTHAHSNHPGGVQATFGDAHVEFFGNNVDLNLWKALSTSNGGEAWGLAGSQ
jgi:prepilin-type N-terminal cleavage/methylation domain-containing protein